VRNGEARVWEQNDSPVIKGKDPDNSLNQMPLRLNHKICVLPFPDTANLVWQAVVAQSC